MKSRGDRRSRCFSPRPGMPVARRAGCLKTRRKGRERPISLLDLTALCGNLSAWLRNVRKPKTCPRRGAGCIPASQTAQRAAGPDPRRAESSRAGRQLRAGRALLAGRAPAPYRGTRREAGRVRGTDRREDRGAADCQFRRGFTDKNLRHVHRFVEAFPEREIVSALSRQLAWTHFRSLIYLDDSLKRDFYAEMCRIERWNTRTLEKKIGGMLFERQHFARPRAARPRSFCGCATRTGLRPIWFSGTHTYWTSCNCRTATARKDLEGAILREIEAFILELGVGFTLVTSRSGLPSIMRTIMLICCFSPQAP